MFSKLILTAAMTTVVLAQNPGSACTGNVAFCAGASGSTNIILRCESGKIQPGNCNDNLGEPAQGAVCLQSSTTAGDAQCKALPLSSTTSAAAVPTPSIGGACNGDVAYCAGDSGVTNIIFRCESGKYVAGNCDDNLDEPPQGAVCLQTSPSSGDAQCKALPLSSSAASSAAATATPSLTPGGACSGDTAYCAGASGQTNIILRCSSGKLQPGNCDDNLGEPALGAICVETSMYSGDAQCKAVTASSTSAAVYGSTTAAAPSSYVAPSSYAAPTQGSSNATGTYVPPPANTNSGAGALGASALLAVVAAFAGYVMA